MRSKKGSIEFAIGDLQSVAAIRLKVASMPDTNYKLQIINPVTVDLERTRSLFQRMEQLLTRTRSKPQPEQVHQVRTTARRLEALLETLHPEPDRRLRKLVQRLRRLRRRAGAVRDVDVQMIALGKLKIGREDQRKARLMQALADLRSTREKRLLSRLTDSRIRKLRKSLRRVSANLLSTVQPGLGRAAAASGRGINRESQVSDHPAELALRMFAPLSRKYRSLSPANIHEYRTQGKRVRYVAEMAGDDPEAGHIVKLLKRQQDAVGDWHDWFTLTETAQSLFANAPDSALLAALRNVTNAKFLEARRVCLDVRRELMAKHRTMLKAKREALTQKRSAAARKAARSRAHRQAASTAPPKRAAAAAVAAADSGAA